MRNILRLHDRCALAGCALPAAFFACLIAGPFRWVFAAFAVSIVLFVLTRPHVRSALRARLGFGRSVAELARRLGRDERDLRRFQPGYSTTAVPKRRGGYRTLHVPDGETKALQRAILHRVLARLAVHPAVTGFERGRSIVDNARPHVGQAVVVSLDVVDFFPATTAPRIDAYFRRIGWNAEAAALLTRLTTHDGGLPQGAPTSPRLSNLVNRHLDERIARRVARFRGAYTRYADDVTFSFPRDRPRRIRGLVQFVRRQFARVGYRLHGRKTRIRRRHQRQQVTGLVVNDKVALPRRTRRWLRAVEHHRRTGRNATLNEQQLAGWQAFRRMIEPDR